MSIELARTVADAVLWEGYLLYPYRATSSKNLIRWQFGVLGPPEAADSSIAEDPSMHCETLIESTPATTVRVQLRFLQLVRRQQQQGRPDDYADTPERPGPDGSLLSFDEAVQRELDFGPFLLSELTSGLEVPVSVAAGQETSADVPLDRDGADGSTGRTVRTRHALTGTLTITAEPVTDRSAGPPSDPVSAAVFRLACTVRNDHPDQVADRDAAVAVSFLGAHLLLQAEDGSFISLLEPPAALEAAAKHCRQTRCWPVLAGSPGDTDVVLASPIILYDYPAVAEESAGALFDSTEIDEILTLRVMTLTDEEKAAARATDPAAAAIIDRCESMPEQTMARMHGILRDPHRTDGPAPPSDDTAASWDDAAVPTFGTPDGPPTAAAPWWDPGVDASVSPTTDTVEIDGIAVGKDSVVVLRPRRNADAQDLFYAGQQAKVTSVYSDVDGNTHVAVVLLDDPAAEMHEWYGRYLYFGPDEIEPVPAGTSVGAPSDRPSTATELN
jgi:hypothetical protein